jgi:hypothetical protein
MVLGSHASANLAFCRFPAPLRRQPRHQAWLSKRPVPHVVIHLVVLRVAQLAFSFFRCFIIARTKPTGTVLSAFPWNTHKGIRLMDIGDVKLS